MTGLSSETRATFLKEAGIRETSIQGLLVIERKTWDNDPRGEFQELARFPDLKATGVEFTPAQWGRSETKPGGLRGMHAEPIQKLVSATDGVIRCVVVDVRPDSPTFKKHEVFEMGPGKRFALFLPVGMANGFEVLGSGIGRYQYLVSEVYKGRSLPSIKYNDTELGLEWKTAEPILSLRDGEQAISLKEYLQNRDMLNAKYLNG